MSSRSSSRTSAPRTSARDLLRSDARIGVTVGEWWTTWTTDTLWSRPSESTNIHYRERTEKFARKHWDLPIRKIGDEHVAASAPARTLGDRNPFANLRLPGSRGRKDVQPPNEAEIARFVALADELTPPSLAAYLDVALHSGMRPGEFDALRWSKLDFQAETILVDEKSCPKTKVINAPKHDHIRTIALTDPGIDYYAWPVSPSLRARR